MRGKLSCLLMIAALVLTLSLASAAYAAESREVSTPEEFMEALLNSKVERVTLADDIEITESISMPPERRNLTIDGKGYTLTLFAPLSFTEIPAKLSVTVRDAVLVADQDVFSILDFATDRDDISFAFNDLTYRGGTLVSLPEGGKITIDGGEYLFLGAGNLPMAEAKVVELGGELKIEDAHGFYTAPVIKASDKLIFLEDAAVYAAAPPDVDTEAEVMVFYQDGQGLLELSPGAKVSFEEIKSVTISYNGGDICMHEHDDICDPDLETGACNHDCAGEQYKCCRNALFMADAEKPSTLAAAGNYLGDYEIRIEYLDGISKQYDAFKSVAPEKLLGAKSMTVTYTPPETIDVKGKILWEDEDNKFDTRPKSVRVKLYRNGIETDRWMTVSKQSFAFEGEAYMDDDLEPYVYTIRQIDDLSPEYKTSHNDKKNTITNTLVTCSVKVHYLDARTEKKIEKSETIKVPKGHPLTIEALDIKGYELVEGADAEYEYKSVTKDREVTFYYDEMIKFSGTLSFDGSVPSAQQAFPKTIAVYLNVWKTHGAEYMKNGGTAPTPQEEAAQIATMPGFAMPLENLADSFDIGAKKFETGYLCRKYDENGEKNIFSFAPTDAIDTTYVFTVDDEGMLHITVFYGTQTKGEGAQAG